MWVWYLGTESQSLNSLQKMKIEQSAFFCFVLFAFSPSDTDMAWPICLNLSLTSLGPLRKLFLTKLDWRNLSRKHHRLDSGPLFLFCCSMIMRVAQLIFIMNLCCFCRTLFSQSLFLHPPSTKRAHKWKVCSWMSRPTPRLHKKRKVHVRPGR